MLDIQAIVGRHNSGTNGVMYLHQ